MAGVEVIALLCAGSTRYHEVGRSSSKDKLSKGEMAGLLAGLNKEAMNLALAKYALDMDAERMLIAHVRVWSAGVTVKSWQIIKGRPVVSNMAALAVFDVVRPNRCPRCCGRGVLVNRVCSGCGGSGYKALSGRQISEAIGIDESCYRRTWKVRYEQIYRYVDRLDQDINRVLYRADKQVAVG